MSRKAGKQDREADHLFDQFEIGLGLAVADQDPKNAPALEMLGCALTRVGRYDEALRIDQELAVLRPKDATVHYNLACSHSLLDNMDEAIKELKSAFDLGYHDYRHLLRDPDLRKVRKDRRFKALLDRKWGKRQSGK